MHFHALLLPLLPPALACSRVTYKAQPDNSRIVIGRSMDFIADLNTTIFAFPAGTKRSGGVDVNPFTWTAKYGSITALAYSSVCTEGMNSEGLTGSTLYLGDSDFGPRDDARPGIFVGLWMQYFLDSYATVQEAVDDICPSAGGSEKFQVVVKEVVPGVATNLHLSFTDLSGDNLIMEFTNNGTLDCYHSPDYNVMTNEPSFDQQLAIDAYWGPVANTSLPGTSRPADRFARLSFYNREIPPADDLETAVSYAAGMIRAVSNPMVPIDPANAGQADIWPTLYRFYTDMKDRILFYESATSPMLFWLDFHDFDLSKHGEAKMLSLVKAPWQSRMGNVTADFELATEQDCEKVHSEC